jgi:hypothetical protein
MILHKSFCLEATDQLALLAEKRADYEACQVFLLQSNLQPHTA